MPPARRALSALGSLQLVRYANNPTKVITELAFIIDKRVNDSEWSEGGQGDNMPLEVQFNEFMDGVNSRGKGTSTKQRRMSVEQAAAILLVTVQKGHVELITKMNDPQTIDVIKILPEAKRILASFLPKLRGYGDVPYDRQYRGAIALAKRHFFPKGNPPTKKELMALLLQSYQEKRKQHQSQSQGTKTLGIQTSFIADPSQLGITGSDTTPIVYTSAFCSAAETPNEYILPNSVERRKNDVGHGIEPTAAAAKVDPDNGVDDDHDVFSEPARNQPIVCTPVAPRSFNPYVTPISNPRHADCVYSATASSSHDMSPIPVTLVGKEDRPTDEGIDELLQATATTQGRLNYYYNKFVAACQKVTLLEGQKEEIERKYELSQKELDKTERHLREANVDRSRLQRWGNALLKKINLFCSQMGEMADPNSIDGEECAAADSESQIGFDLNLI